MILFQKYIHSMLFILFFLSAGFLGADSSDTLDSDLQLESSDKKEEGRETRISGGLETMQGDVYYQIGFPYTDADGNIYIGYFPFSELKFPLDCSIGYVEVNSMPLSKLSLTGVIKKSITIPENHMEDSDWITLSDPDRLDIYSESTISDFSATIVDLTAEYVFTKEPWYMIAGGLGFLYQAYHYDAILIRQWSPSGLDGYDYPGDGTTVGIKYDVTFYVPYLVVSGRVSPSRMLHFKGRFAASPIAKGEDRDQHLLRDKENRGEQEGRYFMVSAEAQFDITQNWFLSGAFDYNYFELAGKMKAYLSGVYNHTVSEEIVSSQMSVLLSIGFKFP